MLNVEMWSAAMENVPMGMPSSQEEMLALVRSLQKRKATVSEMEKPSLSAEGSICGKRSIAGDDEEPGEGGEHRASGAKSAAVMTGKTLGEILAAKKLAALESKENALLAGFKEILTATTERMAGMLRRTSGESRRRRGRRRTW